MNWTIKVYGAFYSSNNFIETYVKIRLKISYLKATRKIFLSITYENEIKN